MDKNEPLSVVEYFQRERIRDHAPDLLKHLENVCNLLERHIMDEARNKGIKPETLCPCMTDDLKKAGDLIKHLTGRT